MFPNGLGGCRSGLFRRLMKFQGTGFELFLAKFQKSADSFAGRISDFFEISGSSWGHLEKFQRNSKVFHKVSGMIE